MALLVFVGGISGVGKTTLLERVPGQNREWIRMSASRLIADELCLEALPIEDYADVLRYQDALVRAYRRRSQECSLPIVMDGHFTLDTGTGVTAVPEPVFRALAPRALVLLRASPDEIRRRRLRRDGSAPTCAEVIAATSAEAAAARAIANALQISLHELPTEGSTTAALLNLVMEVSS